MPESTFQRRVRESLEKKAALAEKAAQPDVAAPNPDADLVPDAAAERGEADAQMDVLMGRIGILDAYNKWNIKGFTAKPSAGQRESIKVRCPFPDHEDKHASAWINLDKEVLNCGACGDKGADKYDLAAIKFGREWQSKGYQKGENFHDLRREMASDMGLVSGFTRVGKEYYPVMDQETSPEKPEQDHPAVDPPKGVAPVESNISKAVEKPQLAIVTDITQEEVDNQNEQMLDLLPPVPWQDFAASGTWLHQWMDITTRDDVPNEFHFGHGLLGLSLVAGGNVRLCEKNFVDEYIIPGNLFICLLGSPGSGKSKSKRHLDNLVFDNLKYSVDPSVGMNYGVKMMGEPASGEVLIRKFSEPWFNPTSSSKTPEFFLPVNGLVEFGELEALMKRIKREGSVLRSTLIAIYDCQKRLSSEAVTTGDKEAHNPFGCVITTTQPRSLPKLLGTDDAGSGFLSRWLFLPGKRKKQIHFGGVNLDVSPTYEEYQKIKGWCGQFNLKNPIGMEEPARELAAEFFQDTLLKDQSRDERDVLRRIDFLFKKMLLLCAINERARNVTTDQVERAIKLYPYLLATYGVSGDRIGETQYDEIKTAILSVLKKQGKDLPLRDIKRSLARRKYQDSDLSKAIKLLQELEYILVIEPPKGQLGRPTTKYRLVENG